MRAKARFEGRLAVLARLRAIVPAAEAELATAQLDAVRELATKIKPRAPGPRTGRYQASLQGDRLANRPGSRRVGGKVKATSIGRALNETKDPNAVGLFADYIWRFLEFGTSKMRAHPHIFPTYRGYKKQIRRKMANAVNRAVRRAKR